MENPMDPQFWTLRQWLAFLLLSAADADGNRSHNEMRPIRVELGNEVVDNMLAWLQTQSQEQRDTVMRDSLPHFVRQRGAQEKLQRMLRDVFMADGEYGPEEQAMTRKIGDWIRAASGN